MLRTTRRLGVGLVGLTLITCLFAAPTLAAAPSYSLFGDASSVTPGNNSLRAVQTTSDATAPGYGGINFTVPTGTTLATLNNLATDYKATAGGCGGGSPRFAVTVQTPSGPQNVFFYLGMPPNYTCPLNTWQNSGNLASPTNLVDATQLGGTFYEPYAQVQAAYGAYPVTAISLVTDAGWKFGTQTVVFDNTTINATTYTYEPTQEQLKDSCKQGGYQQYTGQNGAPGPFKNQAQCVSYFNHQDDHGND